MERRRVVITGVGVVNGCVCGQSPALGAYLAAPRGGAGRIAAATVAGLIEPDEARRLSRVCQLALAAARLALAESGVAGGDGLGLVIGTEFGDLASTIDFADGYLRRGTSGLSALLFPNTVMNTMAATTAIAVGAKAAALTLNVPTVAGELAVARGAAAVASGRVDAVLAGGVDELDPRVVEQLSALGGGGDIRGEGATFVVLEAESEARRRGATILGGVAASAWRALPARPHGVGRGAASQAIAAALALAAAAPDDLGWIYASASGDTARDAWERRVLGAALGASAPPVTSLAALIGHHAGLGALRVAAAAWTARAGLLPTDAGAEPARVPAGRGLVHGVARGGTHVALVVDAA
jgi:3-oxoacyl-[acyl-carrier-protein] synthase II